jgi:hypothetical protein
MVVVPWIVLCELDKLKASHVRTTELAARLALQRLRVLTAERDRIVHPQTATEHARVLESKNLPDGLHRELRNDDIILQVCIYWRNGPVGALRRAGHRAGVILLSNDRGLCLRAETSGIHCFTAAEFPSTATKLAATIPPVEPLAMEEGEATLLLIEEGGAATKESMVCPSTTVPPDDTGHSLAAALPTLKDAYVSNGAAVGSTVADRSGASASQIVKDVIERCLGPGITYYRQQDLGDFWLEMLEAELKPPWSAGQVLAVLSRHSSTFWEVLTRQELHSVRQLAKWLHDHRRNLVVESSPFKPAGLIMSLLQGLHRGLNRPLSENAPDPSTVPDFISLGDARAALEEGIAKISALGTV